MLSRADTDIVRRDGALPALATLLDDQALLAALNTACPGNRVDSVKVTYARYRPGVTCLVGYQLEIGGIRVAAYARTYSSSGLSQIAKARRSLGVPSPLGPGRFVMADGATIVSIFPNDRRVTALAAIGRSDGVITLREELGLRTDTTLEPLAYRPEHSFAGKVIRSDGAQAVLKLYGERTYRPASQQAKPFASRDSLRVASTIARSDQHRAVVSDWLAGVLLSELLQDPAFKPSTMLAVGTALAKLHADEPAGLNPLTPAMVGESLRVVATVVGDLCPELDVSARQFAKLLGTHLLDEPHVYCRLHGDFHPRQVLLDKDAVGFLDFDDGLAGDPTFDLGTFLAHLEREVLRGRLTRARMEVLGEALLEGYEAAIGRPIRERVPLALAVGPFRIMPRCFRYREQNWPERMAALLKRAQEVEGMND
jgi:streptomycin 6-kinase